MLLFITAGPLAAQTPSRIEKIEFVDLPSASRQTYQLFISLPNDYQISKKSYPVVYILDADFNFLHLANLHRQLVETKQLEEAILIGIGYGTTFLEKGNNRWQDFSPTYLPKFPGSGKAQLFMDFLDKRLKPFVAEHYRINEKSTIHGHSMAGLFLTYLLFERPTLFDQYLITSPALSWDKKFFEREKHYHAQYPNLKAKVFLTVAGEEGKKMKKGWGKLKAILESRKYSGLILSTQYYPNQSHIGVIPDAFTEGLLYLHNTE